VALVRVAIVAVSTIVASLSIGAIIARAVTVSVVTTAGVVAMRLNIDVVAVILSVSAISIVYGVVRAVTSADLSVSHAFVHFGLSLTPSFPSLANVRSIKAVSVAAVRMASVVGVL
jgi:hypothetical protein